MIAAPAPTLRFDEVELDNGLRVIGEYNPGASSVAAGYFVQTGARDERPAASGVSHFLEHMVFKGNDDCNAEDINRIFDELGAQYNAFTSEERTVYYGAVLPDRLPELVNLLSQLMRPVLRQDDFDVEKKVILEEIAMYQDQPHFQVFDLSSEPYWRGHPLGNSVLGTTQSITDLKRDQMMAYFEQRYSPGNLVLAVAGNYDWDAFVAQVKQISDDWPSFAVERQRPEPSPATGRQGTVDPKLTRMHVAFYAPGVSLADERRYAASVLASTLGDDDGSRLYWELVDKGIADNAGLDHDAAEDQGAFSGYVSTAPERAEQVIGKYLEVLKHAQDNPPSEDEWRRANASSRRVSRCAPRRR